MIKQRLAIAMIALSATGLLGIALDEGYVETAAPPVAGDVPTNGFGTTTREDGSPLRAGDKTTPAKALQRLVMDAAKFEGAIKRCVTADLYQHEYDAYTSLAYNIGAGAFCSSTLVRKLNAGDYPGACAQILRWDYFKGQRLPGLTARRQREYQRCMGNA